MYHNQENQETQENPDLSHIYLLAEQLSEKAYKRNQLKILLKETLLNISIIVIFSILTSIFIQVTDTFMRY